MGKPSLAGLAISFGKMKKSDDDDDHEDGEEGYSSEGGDDDGGDRELTLAAADDLIDAMKSEDREGIADAIEAIVRSCK